MPPPTILVFLPGTSKASFVCFWCHLRALLCTHQHWECPWAKLSTLSCEPLGQEPVSMYSTFTVKFSVTEVNQNVLVPGPKRYWQSLYLLQCMGLYPTYSTHITTTLTSYTGLWVNQISSSSLNTDGCLKENQIICETNNLPICNGTGCQKPFCYRGVVPSFLFRHAFSLLFLFYFESSFPSSSLFQDCAETSTSGVWSRY